MSNQIENDLNSFIETFRRRRGQSNMINTPRSTSLYLPPTDYGTQSDIDFYPPKPTSARSQPVRTVSSEDVEKMKYKIALGLKEKKIEFRFLFA
jgi:hypothetical protein